MARKGRCLSAGKSVLMPFEFPVDHKVPITLEDVTKVGISLDLI